MEMKVGGVAPPRFFPAMQGPDPILHVSADNIENRPTDLPQHLGAIILPEIVGERNYKALL
jgi:hypothetical protein